MTTALQILIIVTLIGILAGLAVTRYGRGWFRDARQRPHGVPGWHRRGLSRLSCWRCGGPHSCAGRGLSRRNRGSAGHPLGVADPLTARAEPTRGGCRLFRSRAPRLTSHLLNGDPAGDFRPVFLQRACAHEKPNMATGHRFLDNAVLGRTNVVFGARTCSGAVMPSLWTVLRETGPRWSEPAARHPGSPCDRHVKPGRCDLVPAVAPGTAGSSVVTMG